MDIFWSYISATFGSNVSTSITVQRALRTISALWVTANPGTTTKGAWNKAAYKLKLADAASFIPSIKIFYSTPVWGEYLTNLWTPHTTSQQHWPILSKPSKNCEK